MRARWSSHTGERRQRPPARAAARAAAGGLQQRVALSQHPVVVGPDPGQARRAQHQQVVEEAAAVGRVALDQRQVLG